MEKITIKQLVSRYRFKDIAEELATVWEHNPIGTDYRDYKVLYRRLRQAAAVITEYKIHVSFRWDEEWREGRCEVIGTEDPLPSTVEWHESLAEVLGMKIVVDKDVVISEKELLAGLFHEITKMPIEEKVALEKRRYWISWFNNPRNQWRLRRLKSKITLPIRLLYSKFLYKEEVENYKHPRKRKRD